MFLFPILRSLRPLPCISSLVSAHMDARLCPYARSRAGISRRAGGFYLKLSPARKEKMS